MRVDEGEDLSTTGLVAGRAREGRHDGGTGDSQVGARLEVRGAVEAGGQPASAGHQDAAARNASGTGRVSVVPVRTAT